MAKKYKCRVEYLESTGTQYIDTGIKGKNNIDFDYKCIFTNLDGTAQCVGGNWSGAGTSTVSLYLGLIRTNGNFAYHYDGTQSPVVVMNTTVQDTPYSIQGHMWTGEQYMVINGTKSSVGTISSTFTSSLNMYLFGINNNGLSNPAYMKLYYCKIYDNDVLVRDFIPVLDNSGRPAMYDQVSGHLFYNQGTGEFSCGRQIIPVEYLQADGNQYINTGYKPSNTTGVYAKIQYVNTTYADYVAVGTWLSNNRFVAPFRGSANTGKWYSGWGASEPNAGNAIDTNVHEIYLNYKNDRNIRVDSTSLSTSISAISGNWKPLFIFSRNLDGTPSGNMVGKIYGVEITEGTNVVCNYIPAIDENLTPFMFDKVNCTVYLNAGTGQFKVGPNVEKVWGGKKLRRKLALALANLKKPRKYYCEVEYLESTGTQWIDTEYVMTSGHSSTFNGNIMWTQNAATANFFYGYRSVNSAEYHGDMRAFFIYGASPAGRLAIRYGVNTDNSTSVAVSLNTKCNIAFDGTDLKVNGTTYATLTEAYTPANYKNMWLFWCNCTGYYSADVGHFVGRIYNWQIFDNGILVRDFIPVLDWNMKPCMYDKVTEQLFYNQATSGNDFSYGREIHYVDYLESTGTQYINTGLLSTASSTVDTEFSFTSMESGVANNVGVFGGRNATTSNTFTFFKIASATPQYFRFDYNGQATVATTSEMTWNTASKYRFQYNGTSCITTNTTTGESVVTARSPGSTFTQYPIHIFAVNTAGAVGLYLSGRIYYYKYSDGTNSVDMVPAIDENGVGYMFDRVSHTCFLNQGTGAFKYPAREVEYLESDGVPYIDTGIQPTDDYGYKIRNTYTRGGGEQCAIGCMDNGNRFVGIYTSGAENQLSGAWGSFVRFLPAYTWATGDILDVEVNYKNSRKMIVGGTELKDISDVHISGTISNTLYLFARHYGSTITKMQGKIYGVEITNGQNVVADFIPALKDGQIGMYDKVGGVLKTNIGTGSFSKGKIVEPEYE